MASKMTVSKTWAWLKSPGVMAAVTFFSIALAVYQGFFYERRAFLVAAVNSLSPVFDVVKPVGGLDISYGGVNLREAKKSLWSVDITLRNEGNSAIKLDDFDPSSPVRIAVKSAQIVDKPSLVGSNLYLNSNVKLISDSTSVSIAPVIIEPNDYITVNFLILGADAVRPAIEISGKIVGMNSIPLQTVDSSSDRRPLWRQIVGADTIWIQIIRGPVYLLSTIFVIAIIGLLATAISSPFSMWKEKRKRDARREEIRKIRRENALDQKTNTLADEYVENGFSSIAKIIVDTSSAKTKLIAHRLIDGAGDQTVAKRAKKAVGPIMPKWTAEQLNKLGLVALEDGRPVGVEDLDDALDRFCQLIGRSRDELIKMYRASL